MAIWKASNLRHPSFPVRRAKFLLECISGWYLVLKRGLDCAIALLHCVHGIHEASRSMSAAASTSKPWSLKTISMLSGYCGAIHTPHLQCRQYFLQMQDWADIGIVLTHLVHFSLALLSRKQCSNFSTTLQPPYSFPRSEVARGKHIMFLLTHYNVRRGKGIHPPPFRF
jgi:hypothetical protein